MLRSNFIYITTHFLLLQGQKILYLCYKKKRGSLTPGYDLKYMESHKFTLAVILHPSRANSLSSC